jgi:hypothetical protein
MPRTFDEIRATDVALSAVAERRPEASDDAVMRVLAAWAAALDAKPISISADAHEAGGLRRTSRHVARTVVALAVAFTLSSGGIAAAVRGDPFAPIGYMVDKFGSFRDHGRPPSDGLLGYRNDSSRPLPDHARALAEGRPSRGVPRQVRAKPSRDHRDLTAVHRDRRTVDRDGTTDAYRAPLQVNGGRHSEPDPVARPKPDLSGPAMPSRDGIDASPSPKPQPGTLPPPPDEPLPSSTDGDPTLG